MLEHIESRILALHQNPDNFDSLAVEIFHYQATNNPVYRQFLRLIERDVNKVSLPSQIPFLPIGFFKTQKIQSGNWNPETHFESSGTSGSTRSRHYIQSLNWYHTICLKIFEKEIGSPEDFFFIGLLPTYLENPHSSLIRMVQFLGDQSGDMVRFCGLDTEKLVQVLEIGRKSGRQILIFSVSYALIHLTEQGEFDLSDCLVVETGGMKGLKKEMPKPELMELLSEKLRITDLVSEYGMTEMQSQAYSRKGIYKPGFSMRVLVRDLENPMGENKTNGRGALNIIDLANWSTCSFLATDDLGEVWKDGTFVVSGRAESSDVRGCNLLFS